MFKVHDSKAFATEIMPTIGRFTRYKSFLRQLSMYKFQRITTKSAGPLLGAYQHPFFRRNHIDLCRGVLRGEIFYPRNKKVEEMDSSSSRSENGESSSETTEVTLDMVISSSRRVSCSSATAVPDPFLERSHSPNMQALYLVPTPNAPRNEMTMEFPINAIKRDKTSDLGRTAFFENVSWNQECVGKAESFFVVDDGSKNQTPINLSSMPSVNYTPTQGSSHPVFETHGGALVYDNSRTHAYSAPRKNVPVHSGHSLVRDIIAGGGDEISLLKSNPPRSCSKLPALQSQSDILDEIIATFGST